MGMTREEAMDLVESAFDAWEYQYDTGDDWSREHEARDMAIKALEQTLWIPVSERLPEVDEEGESNGVFIALKETIYHMYKCQRVHITKIAFYDKNAISSDGLYMNTEGWVLNDGRTLSMNEVIAWMPLPQPYKVESEV